MYIYICIYIYIHIYFSPPTNGPSLKPLKQGRRNWISKLYSRMVKIHTMPDPSNNQPQPQLPSFKVVVPVLAIQGPWLRAAQPLLSQCNDSQPDFQDLRWIRLSRSQPQSREKRENQHESYKAHILTFWSLLHSWCPLISDLSGRRTL